MADYRVWLLSVWVANNDGVDGSDNIGYLFLGKPINALTPAEAQTKALAAATEANNSLLDPWPMPSLKYSFEELIAFN